jgi:hypothetical protein
LFHDVLDEHRTEAVRQYICHVLNTFGCSRCMAST